MGLLTAFAVPLPTLPDAAGIMHRSVSLRLT
jgi:hypothetical protein